MTTEWKAGDVVTLTVARCNEWGAFLDAKTGSTADDILLHKAQQTRSVEIGEQVEVFLYLDPQKRLTASMRIPRMKLGQVARVKVINTSKDGAFVDIGAERGIFMPFAEMRGRIKIGEMVWIKLYQDKSGRLAVSMKVEEELQKASVPAQGIKIGDQLIGSVYNFNQEGAFLFTTERFIAYLHESEMTIRPKVGEEITVRVVYLREDGRINVSMRPVKEQALRTDSEKILDMLILRHGKMPYSDATSPEIIKEKFQISKSAFKRALGNLLKQNMIKQEDGWTYLIHNIEAGQENIDSEKT